MGIRRIHGMISAIVLSTACLRGGAEEASDGFDLRFKAALEALHADDRGERDRGLKCLVAEGPAALPAIREQLTVETDPEVLALLRSAPDLIDFEELRKDRWIAAAAPEPVPGSIIEFCLSPDGTLLATTGSCLHGGRP